MQKCLLLNGDYDPIRVINERDAVLLVVMENAESIVDTDVAYHSAGGLVIPIPSVLRLIRKVNKLPRRSRMPITRRTVCARDNGRCGYCLGHATTVDHIVPRSRGGRHTWLNVVAACGPCNSKKDDKFLADLQERWGKDRWSLKITPSVPKGQFFIVVNELAAERPEWAPFLAQRLVA